jgi:hypothetical protein
MDAVVNVAHAMTPAITSKRGFIDNSSVAAHEFDGPGGGRLSGRV